MKVALGCSLALLLGLPVAWLAAQDSLPSSSLRGSAVLGTRAIAPPAPQQPAFPEPAAVRGLQSQYRNALEFVANGYYVNREDEEAMKLASQFRRTDDESEKSEIRKKLLELTVTAFKKKMDERSQQVEEAQARLDAIKAEIEQRKELEEKIIARRVADLLDDPDPLAWDVGQPGQRDPASFFMGLNRFAPDQETYGVPTLPVPPNTGGGYYYVPSASGPGQLPPTGFSNRAEAAREQSPQRTAIGNRLESLREGGPASEPYELDKSDL